MENTKEIREILDNFSILDDWEDKYAYLIEIGKESEALDEKYKIESNKVTGCVSQVWLIHYNDELNSEKLYFRADSDAYIVKGLIAIIIKVFSGKSAKEILNIDINKLFQQLHLNEHLSPGRSNGFFSMVNKIKNIAKNYINLKNESIELTK